MMRSDTERLEKDARRIGRFIPEGRSFVLLGYDPEPNEVTVSSIADDVAEIIATSFGGQCQLLGISYGAVVASNVAARFPDRVSKLALIAGAQEFSSEGRVRLQRQLHLVRSGECARLLEEFSSVFRRRWLNVLLKLRIRFGVRTIAERLSPPETISRYLEAMLAYTPDPNWRLQEAPERLMVIGSGDQFFSPSEPSRNGLTVSVLEDETHMVPLERPAAVRAILTSFAKASR